MAANDKWASLSDDIVFEANQSPTDLSMVPTVANWAEQALIHGKARMQKQGLNLQQIKITVRFHQMVTPFKKLKAALAKAAAAGEVLQWIWGTGEAVGDFVIVSWQEKVRKTDEVGLFYATDIDLVLMEYAGPGVEEQTGINAKKLAFANKPNANASTVVAIPSTSQETLSKNLSNIKIGSAEIQTSYDKLKKDKITMENYKRTVVRAASDIRKAVNAVQTAITICRNIKNASSISQAATNLGVAADALGTAAGLPTSVNEFKTLTDDVSNTAGSVESASASAQAVKSWFAPLGG